MKKIYVQRRDVKVGCAEGQVRERSALCPGNSDRAVYGVACVGAWFGFTSRQSLSVCFAVLL